MPDCRHMPCTMPDCSHTTYAYYILLSNLHVVMSAAHHTIYKCCYYKQMVVIKVYALPQEYARKCTRMNVYPTGLPLPQTARCLGIADLVDRMRFIQGCMDR